VTRDSSSSATLAISVPLFYARVRRPPRTYEGSALGLQNLRLMLKISYAGCFDLGLYLQAFRRNSLLKCALQPKIAKNLLKTPLGSPRSFKVIDVKK